MQYQTDITDINDGQERIRGYALADLVKEKSFAEVIFLLLQGDLPTKEQARMMDAILVSVIDHGPGVASAMNARVSASAKNPMHASVAAGLLGLGDRHGVVISQAMTFFQTHQTESDLVGLLTRMKQEKKYVMGYGHKLFTKKDPRTEMLFAVAKEQGIFGEYCAFAQTVGQTLADISSKPLPLNADGAIAAVLCDMGFAPEVGNGFFIMARVPGLVAHIHEENTSGHGIRRIPQEEIDYTGSKKRSL